MDNNYNKIIFVSNNDTCTGPMAKAILQRKQLLYPLEVESRGLVVLFPEPMNPKAENVLEKEGYPLEAHVSTPLDNQDIQVDYLILTMQMQQKKHIMEQYAKEKNVYTLAEYIGGEEDIIVSPHGGSIEEYTKCYNLIHELIDKLVGKLNEH
jgi:Protein-tyrosine-phosphatase